MQRTWHFSYLVKKFCRKNSIDFLDLEDILRALKLRKILKNDELRKLIEDIEERDFTIIKSKGEILEDHNTDS
ncbi:Uncharacterised protein [uncultured archaeon]|nr:Uncharacterised protein [uncultured archaeon]